MNTPPTSEERTWAVIAHLSALALGMGIVIPIVGWSEQRRKSRYASFQSLQALGYQSLGYTIWVLFSAVAVMIFVIIMLAAIDAGERNGGSTKALVVIWMSIYVALLLGLLGIYILFPILAAISCAFGKEYHYPIMGKRLAQYLEYDSTLKSEEQAWLHEEHEFRWVAAMGHFSILVILWGMLAPLTAWILYGKRNSFLKFQSIQTLVYQAGVTTLYLGTVVIYLFGFIILTFMAFMGPTGNVRIDSQVRNHRRYLFGWITLG